MEHSLPDWIIFAIGFAAQLFFTVRTLSQWLISEKHKRIETPSSYWVFSVLGAWTMIFYGVLRDDFAIILGQMIAYYVYLWNLSAKGMWAKINVSVRVILLLTPFAAILMLMQNATVFFDNLFRNSEIPLGLLIFGSAGQIIFTLRFVYQWLYCRHRGESILPIGFWIISIIGSSVIIAYGIFRKDPVLILGQSFGFVAYIRNIMIGGKGNARCSENPSQNEE